ncbi:MAG: DUF4956 domain-containing protein [Pseudomonadota bacterium]
MRAATRLRGPAFLISAYFAALWGVVEGLRRLSPELERHLPFGGIDVLAGSDASDMEIVTTLTEPLRNGNVAPLSLALALVGAVALMLPISWVYFITTRAKQIDRSFAQTMMVLPVIVAGIATIVQNSLALAFSLAGIVAAVRFRFTLNEPAHALYVFVAIVIGLAAGINALGIAYVTAIGFVATNLVLWRLNYGADLTTPFFSFLTGRGRDDNEL